MALDPFRRALWPITAFDGEKFEVFPDMPVNMDVIRWFKPDNFISVYIPDYGAIVLNTVDPELFEKTDDDDPVSYPLELKDRLNQLVAAIEIAFHRPSGAGQRPPGRPYHLAQGAEPEKKRFWKLNEKARKMDELNRHLQAVGAVNADQLNMIPLIQPDGGVCRSWTWSLPAGCGLSCLPETFS